MKSFVRPETVEINAWSGAGPVPGPNIDPENNWELRSRRFTPRSSARFLLPAAPPDERDWLNPRVGWGLVLLDDPKLSNKDLAAGEDVSKPLKDLVAARKGVILRYAPSSTYGFLRRYFADGSEPSDLDISASGVGTGDGYAGFADLYQPDPKTGAAKLVEVACRVGEDVAIPAPHRPGRADYPHPVLHA